MERRENGLVRITLGDVCLETDAVDLVPDDLTRELPFRLTSSMSRWIVSQQCMGDLDVFITCVGATQNTVRRFRTPFGTSSFTKDLLDPLNNVHILHLSPQLSCGDTCKYEYCIWKVNKLCFNRLIIIQILEYSQTGENHWVTPIPGVFIWKSCEVKVWFGHISAEGWGGNGPIISHILSYWCDPHSGHVMSHTLYTLTVLVHCT